jgi:hypothetical protein
VRRGLLPNDAPTRWLSKPVWMSRRNVVAVASVRAVLAGSSVRSWQLRNCARGRSPRSDGLHSSVSPVSLPEFPQQASTSIHRKRPGAPPSLNCFSRGGRPFDLRSELRNTPSVSGARSRTDALSRFAGVAGRNRWISP